MLSLASLLLFPLVALTAPPSDVDQALRALIEGQTLTGTPLLRKPGADIHSPLAQLGKRLFFSTSLGGTTDTACVSCHHPLLGGGDNLPLSIGVQAEDPKRFGPGRKPSPKAFDFDGGPNVPRNAPTIFNTVFYSRCLFWDCRIESLGATPGMNGSDNSIIRTPDTMWGMPRMPASSLLQAQVAFPVTSGAEMRAQFMKTEDNNELRETLAKRILAEEEQWRADFQRAFNATAPGKDLITFENISLAVAEYEASQVFVRSPWQSYVQGQADALTDTAKQGALLFFRTANDGGYGCAQCHTGDFFTDEEAHVTAIPQIGRGKEDGEHKDHDFGRYVQTGEPEHQFAFRTPSLLNVEVTGPYGHTGAYADLKAIIRHMINPAQALQGYDFELTNLDPTIQKARARENTAEALSQFAALQTAGKSKLTPKPIDEAAVEQLHAFLLSLTDPCVKDRACMNDWLN